MTIKELYEKYSSIHVIYSFKRCDDGVHVRVLTPKERILIEEYVLEDI